MLSASLQVREAALAPLVRYNELASALQGLAAAASASAAPPAAGDARRDELQPQRLRSMVGGKEIEPHCSLRTDASPRMTDY